MKMKLGLLKEIIDNTISNNPLARDCEVTIVVREEGGIGATPSVGIRSAGKGFDWDGHMFMLSPEISLYKNNSRIVNIQKVDNFDNRKR